MDRSYQTSKEGLEKAKAAFKLKNWTQDYLAGGVGCSRQVVINFFAGRTVDKSLFQSICNELGLEWGDVADLESEQLSTRMNTTQRNSSELIQERSSTTQVKSHAFAIAGTVSPEDIAKLKAIVALIQEVSQDSSIKIVDIERGSIKLILEGSQKGLERLENLFKSGKIKDVLGVSVEDVEFVTLPNSNSDKKQLVCTIAGDIAESEIAILKAALIETSDDTVEQSQSQNPISQSNSVSHADLLNAYLNRPYLSGTHLAVAGAGDRNINTGGGNYNERIQGNNFQGDGNRAVQGDNNQAVLGDNNQVTQQNQVGADTGESLTKEDVVKLLAQLETLIQGAELPGDTKEEVIEDLSAAKKATDKEEPNKQRALERLGTVAETLDKTSKGVEAGQKIWTTAKPIIVKVASWLGAAAGSHLLGL
jgi:transcriptional regulator with XRE-family HTH domain